MRFNFCVFCENPKSDQTLVHRTEGQIHYHQKCLDKSMGELVV